MVSKTFLRTSIKRLKSLGLTDQEIIAKLEGIGLKESEIREGLDEAEKPETDEKKYGLEKLQFDELFDLQEETPIPIVGQQTETENIFIEPEEKKISPFDIKIESQPIEEKTDSEQIQTSKPTLEERAFNEDYLEIEKIENVRVQASVEEEIEDMKSEIKYWQSSSAYQLEVLQNEIIELSKKLADLKEQELQAINNKISQLKEQEINDLTKKIQDQETNLSKKINSLTDEETNLAKKLNSKELISENEEGYLEYEINTKIERIENKTILLGKELKKLVAIQKELLENLIQKA